MNNYRIIISMNKEQVIFEIADTMHDVHAIIGKHLRNTPKCITVYELNDGNEYRIVDRIMPEPKEERRLIGFCRW